MQSELDLENLLVNADIEEKIYSFIPSKDLDNFAKISATFHNRISYEYLYWKDKISEENVNPKLLSEFHNFCETKKLAINYRVLCKNLHNNRHYLKVRPLANFKSLFIFAFTSDFKLETINLFIPTEKELSRDAFKRNPLRLAFLLGDKDLIKKLQPYFTVDETETFTLAQYAIRGGHIELAMQTSYKVTPKIILPQAVLSGSFEILERAKKLYLDTFGSLKLNDSEKQDCISSAIETDIVPMLQKVMIEFVNNEWNITNENQDTLLHIAVLRRKPTITQFLIETHPELLGKKNETLQTPAFSAFKNSSVNIINLFMQKPEQQVQQLAVASATVENIYNSLFALILNNTCLDEKEKISVFNFMLEHCNDNEAKEKLLTGLIYIATLQSFEALQWATTYLQSNKAIDYKKLLNTFFHGQHLMEIIVERSNFSKNKNALLFLKNNLNVSPDISSRIANNLLKHYALQLDYEGVEFCVFSLNASPTDEILKEIDTKEYDVLNPGGSLNEFEEVKKMHLFLDKILLERKQTLEQQTKKEKIIEEYLEKIKSHSSKLEKMLTLLTPYENKVSWFSWLSNSDYSALHKLCSKLKNLTTATDEQLMDLLGRHIPSTIENIEIKAIWDCLVRIVYENSNAENNNNIKNNNNVENNNNSINLTS